MLQYLTAALLILIGFATQRDFSQKQDCYALRVSAPHRRMRPISANFNNDFLYVLYRLNNHKSNSTLFSESPKRTSSLLRVSPRMYFSEHYSRNGYSILDNLKQVLRDRAYDPDAMCHHVWLMTLPITCGLTHVNNVTVAWLYANGLPTCTIFSTHNTSGERHIYLLDHNKPGTVQAAPKDSGYQYTALIPRAFHISPLDSRSGYYRFTWNSPFDYDDGTPQHTVRKPTIRTTVFDSNMQAVLVGRLEVDAVEKINLRNVVKLVRDHAFSNLRIVRQLVKQGWFLHVKNRLPLHPAPPMTESRINPTQTEDMSGFMGLPTQPALSRLAQGMVVDALIRTLKSHHRNVRICFEYTDKNIPPVILEADSEKEKQHLNITVRSFEFYKQMLISPNPEYVVHVLIQNCEDLARVSDSTLFFNVLNSTRIESNSQLVSNFRHAYRRLVTDGTKTDNIRFSLNVESFISASWLAGFAVALIYLEWKVLKGLYEMFGVRIVPRLTPWRPFDRLQPDNIKSCR